MTTSADGPSVVVGPLLRYVGDTTATLWVETDRPCEVEVLGHRTRTWDVHDHHYALVVVEGLEPDSRNPYEVRLDGQVAWPEPGSPHPPSVIHTLGDDDRLRLAFGSCRRAAPFDRHTLRTVGADALVALAQRMMAGDDGHWPHALLLAGDQVYADEPSPALKERLRRLHDLGERVQDADERRERGYRDPEVREEIVDFEEYTWLYHESWRTPSVRWLLSTLPTAMILDDHDLRDDWNSSWSWRQETSAKPWWRDRVVGAFSSYWVYQHLGNLSPRELEDDELYRQVRDAPDGATRAQLLADFSLRADTEPDTARWSFVRDFGRTRLVVLDSRCSRRLDPDDRAMVDDKEWAWFREVTAADVDHLLIGTSLPFLLVHGVHHLEGWDEAIAQGAWGEPGRRLGEQLRRAVDLEHWAAFRGSFDAMVELVQSVAGRERPPASVLWLSGDVHCSYIATADVEGVDDERTAIVQLTMSPFRNPLGPFIRRANRWLDRPAVAGTLRWLARRAGVRDPGIAWDVDGGPWFSNGVMTVDIAGRRAAVEVEHAHVVQGSQVLDRTLTRTLTH
ncbi:MAG: alkaline phosphatase D family protein [Angustibacter sp.]